MHRGTAHNCLQHPRQPQSQQVQHGNSRHEGHQAYLSLQVHGSIVQARTLLEVNAPAVASAELLQPLLPLLQQAITFMHPGQKCAAIRNEATVLAAAVLALPDLPNSISPFAREVHKMGGVIMSCNSHPGSSVSRSEAAASSAVQMVTDAGKSQSKMLQLGT